MASAFGHAFAAVAIGNSYAKNTANLKFLLLGVFCSVFPDADVITFNLGIDYLSFWGHRGFTHSLVFAVLFSFLITFLFYRKDFFKGIAWKYVLFFFVCTASHGFFDALTSGGEGVAFFAPFDNDRYFLPWRPIKVSPIGAGRFFSEWGLKVLLSELIWIGVPGLIYMYLVRLARKGR